jgi:phosphoribosylformylglycinamidine (FGAM) synthase PurS component
MFWRVEVVEKKGFFDAIGASVKKDISDLGLGKKVKEVKYVQVYLLDGDLDEIDLKRICRDLLVDPVTQDYKYDGSVSDEKGYKAVEVAYNPGVMDPVEDSALKAILDLGVEGIRTIRTAKKYLIKGSLSHGEIRSIAEKILYNKVIQHLVKGQSVIAPEPPPYKFQLNHFNIIKASDKELLRISKDGQLFMTLDEMRAVKTYFRKLGRNPTDVELETIAQTWSEHCKHKTFRGLIEYTEEIPKSKNQKPNNIQNPKTNKRLINNLLKKR